jgi:hypothetical protein
MQRLEDSGAVRHIYIYIYVIGRLKVKICIIWGPSPMVGVLVVKQ